MYEELDYEHVSRIPPVAAVFSDHLTTFTPGLRLPQPRFSEQDIAMGPDVPRSSFDNISPEAARLFATYVVVSSGPRGLQS